MLGNKRIAAETTGALDFAPTKQEHLNNMQVYPVELDLMQQQRQDQEAKLAAQAAAAMAACLQNLCEHLFDP